MDPPPTVASLYTPLRTATAIRLLAIQPGEHGSDLICEVKHDDLDAKPAYEALSYVWGNAKDTIEVICNDRKVSITRNLADALHRLRQTGQVRILWVDALCINQTDVHERSSQVRIMRDIYSSAVQVIVWLGPDMTVDVARARNLIVAISLMCQENRSAIEHSGMTAEKRLASLDISMLDKFSDATESEVAITWKALADFYARPYWTRAWVIQEVAAARKSTIVYGELHLEWQDIGWTTDWLIAQALRYDFKMPPLLELIKSDDPQRVGVMRDFSKPDSEDYYDTLLEALRASRVLQATDPRDKVYAFLGLMPNDVLTRAVEIDYDCTVVETYTRLAVASLECYQNLSILSYTQHLPEYQEDSPCPSWVPRWDTVSEAGLIQISSLEELDWSTCGTHRLQKWSFEAPRILRLQGFTFEAVGYTSASMNYLDFDLARNKQTLSPVLDQVHRFLGSESLDLAIKDTKQEVLSLAKTFTLEYDADWAGNVIEMDEDRYWADFCDYVRHAYETYQSVNPADPKEGALAELAASFAKYADGGDWQRYEIAASRDADARRFFCTKDLRVFGLGPDTMRNGDIVVILFGGRTPYILRPHVEADGSRWYTFIGAAYVSHIMRGTLMPYFEQGDFEEVEFEVR
ncbi:uncharacterized protein HMPREF1541_03476 [Cyphellophora europaea CBS 101466]|uniref:Heterokaryon incompatibility domain-containing protein n=1 Tax=Cyphellophora europaea (strain CBS 101466) TaxID=1220924 RepID=W2RYY3_CYPE1|nr:uncharacterized protein HMPREF1541_03476 [Cyphellophora europaea CBS 101466]ETN41540.1 hypothetical protein HMPREF1541_03476 [Cyphellophora europaea CBS 101466]